VEWNELYDQVNVPTLKNIEEFINNELWAELNIIINDTYKIQPKLSYSNCSMQKGWNVKYAKSGKSLCTLYPMKDYFIALVVVGNKEMFEVEAMLPLSSQYTQDLYSKTPFSLGGRWLMINVSERAILDDVINLLQIRVKPKVNSKS
jgi:hypothetical protein